MRQVLTILLLTTVVAACSTSKSNSNTEQRVASNSTIKKNAKKDGAYQLVYHEKFEDAVMDVPDEPNVEFSFVVKAPKEFVMDAWNLPKGKGGSAEGQKEGNVGEGEKSWPGISNDMERKLYVYGIPVTQIVGNVQTPENGDWHFEWKAGLPYYKMPYPFSVIMKSVHGQATLSDGPNENETTVTITNRHNPGVSLGLTTFGIKATTPGLAKKAPKRFKKGAFLGPQ